MDRLSSKPMVQNGGIARDSAFSSRIEFLESFLRSVRSAVDKPRSERFSGPWRREVASCAPTGARKAAGIPDAVGSLSGFIVRSST